MPSTNNTTFQSAAPATPPAGFVVRTEEIVVGGATAHVQVMRLGAPTANSSEIVSTAFPLPVRLQDSTALVSIQGNVSAAVAGNVSALIGNSSGGFTTANPLPIYLQGSTALVSVQGNVSAAISGNTTAIIGNSSGAFSTANPLPVLLQSSTATVSVQGNTTAILTSGSKVQVEPGAGAVFPISGNATVGGNVSAVVTALPGTVQIGTTGGTTALLIAGADGGTSNATARTLNVNASRELLITGPVSISGNATAIISTASKIQVEPGAAAIFGISGNATVALTTGTTGRVELASGGIGGTSGNALWIQPTTTVPISGNTTAILTTGSKVQVEPGAAAVFPISGNTTALLSTAQFAELDFDTSAVTVAARFAVGIAVPSLAGPVLLGTTAGLPVISGNSSGGFTTGNPLPVLLQGSTATVTVQGNVSAVISGNTTAIVGNSSGAFSTANPLPVLLQGSTATVTVQGNVSAAVAGNVTALLTTGSITRVDLTASPVYAAFGAATASGGLVVLGADGTATNSTVRPIRVNASQELLITGAVAISGNATVAGNVSAVISGNATAVISNTSGNITTANPLAVFLQGSTATVTVAGNVSAAVAGNVTALLTTGSISRIDWPAAPGPYAAFGAIASGGLVVLGMDGTATNSTARPLQVDASGKLKVDAGAIQVGGLAQINTTGGSTMMIVGGMDGGTSNSTARALRVNASGELLTVGGSVAVAGAAVINTTAGTSALLIAGADGNTSNSTARFLKVNASQELVITGAVTIAGNATAIITTGSIIQTEPKVGAVYPISGNATVAGNVTAIITTASVIRVEVGSSGFPIDALTTGSRVRIESTGTLTVSGNVAVSGNVSAVWTLGAPRLTRLSVAVTTSGETVLVASGAGPIRLYRALLSNGGTTNTVQFFEGSATALCGPLEIGPFGSLTLDFDGEPWFQAASNSSFVMKLTATGLSGAIWYTTA